MSKPSALPRWNDVQSGNSAYNVNPPGAKKDSGWAVDEIPAGQHINWLFNLIYQWLLWLSGSVATYTEAYTAASGHPGAALDVRWDNTDNSTTGKITTTYSNVQQPDDWYIPLLMKSTETISAVRVFVNHSAAPHDIRIQLLGDSGYAQATVGTSMSPGDETIAMTGLTAPGSYTDGGGYHVVAYWMRIFAHTPHTGGTATVYRVEVDKAVV
jgi:hypothetical protein